MGFQFVLYIFVTLPRNEFENYIIEQTTSFKMVDEMSIDIGPGIYFHYDGFCMDM